MKHVTVPILTKQIKFSMERAFPFQVSFLLNAMIASKMVERRSWRTPTHKNETEQYDLQLLLMAHKKEKNVTPAAACPNDLSKYSIGPNLKVKAGDYVYEYP